MIQLDLFSGKTICFNLNNYEREKKLRDTWYSMSDMPKYATKQLRIKTDINNEFLYKINEIKNCLFIDRIFLYGDDEDKIITKLSDIMDPTGLSLDQKETVEEFIHTPSILATDLKFATSPFMENNKGMSLGFLEQIKNILEEMFNKLPQETQDKTLKFYLKLNDLKIPFQMSDPKLIECARNAIMGPYEDIDKYVQIYYKYWKEKNK